MVIFLHRYRSTKYIDRPSALLTKYITPSTLQMISLSPALSLGDAPPCLHVIPPPCVSRINPFSEKVRQIIMLCGHTSCSSFLFPCGGANPFLRLVPRRSKAFLPTTETQVFGLTRQRSAYSPSLDSKARHATPTATHTTRGSSSALKNPTLVTL